MSGAEAGHLQRVMWEVHRQRANPDECPPRNKSSNYTLPDYSLGSKLDSVFYKEMAPVKEWIKMNAVKLFDKKTISTLAVLVVPLLRFKGSTCRGLVSQRRQHRLGRDGNGWTRVAKYYICSRHIGIFGSSGVKNKQPRFG